MMSFRRAFPSGSNGGLTIREYTAIHLMGAYIATMPGEPRLPGETYDGAAEKAVRMTDALLKRLGES